MKINEIYIKAFGGLTDYKLDFNPEFQIIYGENESGKTTIQNFIKTIFYGFSKSGNSVETNNRKKYIPWSGKQMGGYIIFTHQGFTYRLDRSFGKSKSNDQTKLQNESNGEEIHLKNYDQPGYELFQISAIEFVNMAFLENPQIPNKTLPSLDQKINRKIGLAEYDWSYDEMIQRLNKAKKHYQADRGSTGFINNLERQAEELQINLKQAIECDQNIARLSQDIELFKKKLTKLEKRENNLKLQKKQHEKLKTAESFEKYKRLQAELESQAKIEGESKSDILKSKSVTVQDLTEIAMQRQQTAYALSEFEIKQSLAKQRLREQNKYLQEAEQKKADILRERSRLQYLKQSNLQRDAKVYKKRTISVTSFIPLALAEIFFLIGGLLLRKSSPVFAVILIVLAVILPFLMVVFYYILQKRQENQAKQYQAVVRKHEMRKLKIENDLQDLEWNLDRIENHAEEFDKERSTLTEQVEQAKILYQRELNKLKHLIKPYFTKLPNDDQLDLAIQTLREQTVDGVQNQERIKAIKNDIRKLKGNYHSAEFYQSYLDAQNWLKKHQKHLRTFPEYSAKYIDTQLQGVTEQRLQYREKLATDKTSLNHLNKNQTSTINLEKKLLATEKKLKEAQENYNALLMSTHLLEQCRSSFEQEIRPRLNEKAAKYLSAMTGNDANDLRIDQDFNIKLKSDVESYHEQVYYSGGLNDQINLALRLALADLLQDSVSKIPLILDDPFIQLDENRAKNTLDLLKKLGIKGKRQILLFTSLKSIYSIINKETDIIRRLK